MHRSHIHVAAMSTTNFGSRLSQVAAFGSRALRSASRFGSRAASIGQKVLDVGAPVALALSGGSAAPLIAGAQAGVAGLRAVSRAAGSAARGLDAARSGNTGRAQRSARAAGGSLREAADQVGNARASMSRSAAPAAPGGTNFRRSNLEAG